MSPTRDLSLGSNGTHQMSGCPATVKQRTWSRVQPVKLGGVSEYNEPSLSYKVAPRPDQATEKTLLQTNIGDGERKGGGEKRMEKGKMKRRKLAKYRELPSW